MGEGGRAGSKRVDGGGDSPCRAREITVNNEEEIQPLATGAYLVFCVACFPRFPFSRYLSVSRFLWSSFLLFAIPFNTVFVFSAFCLLPFRFLFHRRNTIYEEG